MTKAATDNLVDLYSEILLTKQNYRSPTSNQIIAGIILAVLILHILIFCPVESDAEVRVVSSAGIGVPSCWVKMFVDSQNDEHTMETWHEKRKNIYSQAES